MANPSAIVTGSGTEVLRRAYKDSMSNSPVTVLIDGVADHIYTILSVIFCEQGNAAETFSLRVNIDGGDSTYINLLAVEPIGAYETFIFSDKVCMAGTDELEAFSADSAAIDVWVSYIDQDFS